MNTIITLEQARKVLEVVDAGLCKGKGKPVPGQMCVEAAVCYALGQPHGDEPKCVSPSVRAFKIALNDLDWSSNKARAKGMRQIAIAQLGTVNAIDEKAFREKLAELTIRQIVPLALRAAASTPGNAKHKDALEAVALRCELEGTKDAANAAANAANAANAAANAANANANAAAYAANANAANAAYAAYAANAANAAYANAANANAANANAAAAQRDAIYALAAELGVQALRFVGAAGIKLMDKLID